jgi:hypothetical protein
MLGPGTNRYFLMASSEEAVPSISGLAQTIVPPRSLFKCAHIPVIATTGV